MLIKDIWYLFPYFMQLSNITDLFACRCARVYQQQLIRFGTSLWTYQQLLMGLPSPWTSASIGSPRLNTSDQCPKSGAWTFSRGKISSYHNLWRNRCSKCNSHQESTKQLTMQKLPVVASFHLKRLDFNEILWINVQFGSEEWTVVFWIRFTSPSNLLMELYIFGIFCFRFEHSSRLHKKITTRVDFPEIVDMSPYISHARCANQFVLFCDW